MNKGKISRREVLRQALVGSVGFGVLGETRASSER